MERRNFFKGLTSTVIASGIAPGLLISCDKSKQDVSESDDYSDDDHRFINKIAGMSLKDLYDKYRSDLFDEFLPFMDKYIIDHQLGGFMCDADRDGTLLDTNKRIWYQGRGVWVYSFLYNNFGKDPKHLEIARKTVEWLEKTTPPKGKLWTPWFTKDGKPIGKEETEIYSDLHVAQGYTQYALASGDMSYWDKAKDIWRKCVDVYNNRPGYGIDAHFYQVQINEKKRYEGVPNPRIVGHWMDFLTLVTQMLEIKEDPEIEDFAALDVDSVLNKHYNPEYRLITEYLNKDYTRINGPQGREVTGHTLETLWMILYEAVRKKDKKTFDKAAGYLRRHIELLYDYVYEGSFQGLMDVDTYEFDMTKALWVQDEILVGCMYVYEHTGALWAKEWYERVYNFVQEKASLKKHGLKLWNIYADRKMTFEPHYNRIGNYHHPRELMLNLLSIERIISNNGALSNPFIK
jgi:mannose/cellobiose epimerase-like protein (N-acyl-D-glucosamine 2-epimerase family)